MVTVARCESPIEAHIVKGALEQAGIPAFVAHEHFVWANWLLSNAAGGVKVQVPDVKYEEAIVALARVEEVGDSAAEEEYCSACGIAGEPRRSGASSAALFALVFFSIPLPFRRTRWRCSQCGQTWVADSRTYYPLPVILMAILLSILVLVVAIAAIGEVCRINDWSRNCF